MRCHARRLRAGQVVSGVSLEEARPVWGSWADLHTRRLCCRQSAPATPCDPGRRGLLCAQKPGLVRPNWRILVLGSVQTAIYCRIGLPDIGYFGLCVRGYAVLRMGSFGQVDTVLRMTVSEQVVLRIGCFVPITAVYSVLKHVLTLFCLIKDVCQRCYRRSLTRVTGCIPDILHVVVVSYTRKHCLRC